MIKKSIKYLLIKNEEVILNKYKLEGKFEIYQ